MNEKGTAMLNPISKEFPMAQAKKVTEDLFKPNHWIYWIDFLFFDLLGWASFVCAVTAPDFSFRQIAAFVVAAAPRTHKNQSAALHGRAYRPP